MNPVSLVPTSSPEMPRLPRGRSLAIVDDPRTIATIDVLETAAADADRLLRLATALLQIAAAAPDFLGGAVHRGLPPQDQPLVWLPGAVPPRRRFVALYARWRADGRRLGFAGVPGGHTFLSDMATLTPAARAILDRPEASLYIPTLLDAAGELCAAQSDCGAGRGIGPLIDDANPRAQFINVFKTTPERQEALLQATYAIMPIARAHRGYLRTALHRSLDGMKVANYGQYRDVADIRAMYLHLRTAAAFGGLLLKDVTEPAALLGVPLSWRGSPVGSTPRLRCYDVARVVLPDDWITELVQD